MIRHIVLYRLKEQDKEQNARTMKEKLEDLNGKIEGLHGLRIDRDCNTHQYDVCMTADFDDPAALQAYNNPKLKALLACELDAWVENDPYLSPREKQALRNQQPSQEDKTIIR